MTPRHKELEHAWMQMECARSLGHQAAEYAKMCAYSNPDKAILDLDAVLIRMVRKVWREALRNVDIVRGAEAELPRPGDVSDPEVWALQQRRAASEPSPYVPHQWVCASCGFVLSKMTLRAADGAVGIDTREVQDICPNDGTSLTRLTWEQHATESLNEWQKANERAAELQAKLNRCAPHSCPTCGPNVNVDEDLCCVACGADTVLIPQEEPR